MSPWSTLRFSENALFSRHWYSTVSDWGDPSVGPPVRARAVRPDRPFPLPFFPVGQLPAGEGVKDTAARDALGDAYRDARQRFERLARRAWRHYFTARSRARTPT